MQDEQGNEDRDDEDRRVGGGGTEIPAADALEDLHGHGRPGAVVQDDRGAELGQGRDPHDDPAGDNAGEHDRHNDLQEGPHRRDAQIDGSLLNRGVDLGEQGGRGLDGIENLPDKVGQHQDHPGAGQNEDPFVVRRGQGNTLDRARDGQGQHDEQIQQIAHGPSPPWQGKRN